MEKSSWACTVSAQLCICIGLYAAFNLGQPQKLISSEVLDFYFLTVRGGDSRPLNQQTNLLKLMDKVSKTFNARFIISVSKLGEADPLMHNGTENFKGLRVPWYTTKASETGNYYFQEQIKIPFGKKMDVIAIDTALLKDSIVLGSIKDEQYQQMRNTNSNWRIAIGFHPMISCQGNKDRIEEDKDFRALHDLFLKFRVNVYLSAASHGSIGGLAYTENPSSIHQHTKNDDLIPTCRRSSFFTSELVDGLLLHQVTTLKIITYFVNSTGEVVHRSILRHLGKEVM